MWKKLCASSLALLALLIVDAAAEPKGGFDSGNVTRVADSGSGNVTRVPDSGSGNVTRVADSDGTHVAVIENHTMRGGKKGAMKKTLIGCLHKAGVSREDTDKMDDVRNEYFGISLGSGPHTVAPEVALKAVHAALRCFSRRRDNTQCCSERRVSDKCKVFCDGRSPAKYESIGLEELVSECSGNDKAYIDTALECHIDRYSGYITDAPKVRPTAGVTPTAKGH